MGILNINDDSFYEGSRFEDQDVIALKAEQMVNEGADILDIGGQSTRPASVRISAEEEIKRVIPVIEMLSKKTGKVLLSIDTYHSSVAEAAINAGASIVNDISAGEIDKNMIETVTSLGVPYICMHLKGLPETMHLTIHYENVVTEVLDFFIKKIEECRIAGIKDVIIDPGFGFGKTIEHNLVLLKNLSLFKILEKPIMAGLSRKSTIYKTLQITAEESLNGTTVLNTIALQNGVNILRVHDVKEAKEAARLVEAYGKA
jgi:dihydropteroate synthase